MTTYEQAKLLNERVLRATSYIEKLRNDNAGLKEEIASLRQQLSEPVSVVDSEEYNNLKAQYEELTKALETLNKAKSALEEEKADVERELQQALADLDLVSRHNSELEDYVSNLKEDTKKIEESMAESLAALDEIGLDDVELASIDELDTAESFSTGEIEVDQESIDEEIDFGLEDL